MSIGASPARSASTKWCPPPHPTPASAAHLRPSHRVTQSSETGRKCTAGAIWSKDGPCYQRLFDATKAYGNPWAPGRSEHDSTLDVDKIDPSSPPLNDFNAAEAFRNYKGTLRQCWNTWLSKTGNFEYSDMFKFARASPMCAKPARHPSPIITRYAHTATSAAAYMQE